jgi:putative endonuclease
LLVQQIKVFKNRPITHRHPGLDPGSRFLRHGGMAKGGWVYFMADRYRGTMYVGVTSNLPARIEQHLTGSGSDFCKRYGLNRLVWAEHGPEIDDCIAHEKRIKRWRRNWKFALIEKNNPDWRDFSDLI